MNTKSLLLSAGLLLASSVGAMAQTSFAVVMSDSGSVNPFWAAVAKGAEEQGAKLGIPVAVLAPAGGETDVAGQIAIVEDQLAKGISGIAIAPADQSALVPVLQRAIDQGVKVIFIDKKAEIEGISYIGTDNVPAAKLGASYVCDNVESGSEVAILHGTLTNTTGQARFDGAEEALKGCGMNIVAEQPADWDTGKALTVTENILTANPNVKAIVASNDSMALGAVEALRAANLLDQVVLVGFDGTPGAAKSIIAGDMEASVAQRPQVMGAMGIDSLLALTKGESVDANIDTGAALVTAENAAEYQ